jgi:predicted nucleic acid-binding protein
MSIVFALDTSCVIPLLSSWHEFHARTKQDYETRRARRERLVIPVHVLLESFAVLTRMPVRLSPADAQRLLEASFYETAEIAALSGGAAWTTIQDLSLRDMGGGIAHDAAIARTAFDAGASVLLTWNAKDFLRVAPPGLEIRQP